jgi:hypothetical protein
MKRLTALQGSSTLPTGGFLQPQRNGLTSPDLLDLSPELFLSHSLSREGVEPRRREPIVVAVVPDLRRKSTACRR